MTMHSLYKSISGMDNPSIKLECAAYKEFVKESSGSDIIKFRNSERFPELMLRAVQILLVLPNSTDCEWAVSCYYKYL